MTIRVLYWISEEAHKRVVSTIQERYGFEQLIVIPTSVSSLGFALKNIRTYRTISDIEKIIDKFKPDIFFQCTASRSLIKLRKKIKHGFMAHGVWPKSVTNVECVSKPFYQGFDLVCGASNMIKELFEKYSNSDTVVATDVLTQFDILYDRQKSAEDDRRKLIGKADRLITLFGHNITHKTDKLRPYDKGYYDAVDMLARLAKKNNWMVYVKTKSDEVHKQYDNNNLKMVHYKDDPYLYFCSDLVITSTRSTVEVEAALTKKPIIRIFAPTSPLSKDQRSYEYGALDFNAVYLVENLEDLERTILASFEDNSELHERQTKFVKHLGITFDGRANERFLDAIQKLFDGDK